MVLLARRGRTPHIFLNNLHVLLARLHSSQIDEGAFEFKFGEILFAIRVVFKESLVNVH